MKRELFKLELITPCFCAGANQAEAEVRASSVRGQLRWWFRALGGSASEERQVFGGISGEPSSSSVGIRIAAIHRAQDWNPPAVDPNSADSYVWYFASVSGKAPGSGRKETGPRWSKEGCIPPGSTFNLEIQYRRPMEPAVKSRFDAALSCFLQLGAFGLRITRGLGAFVCRTHPYSPNSTALLQAGKFRVEVWPTPLANLDLTAKEIGALVKGTRKQQGWQTTDKKTVESPFGSSDPRQTSAVYFRPVLAKLDSSEMRLIIFEAPQARVLRESSRKPSVIGHVPSKISKPQPRRPFQR